MSIFRGVRRALISFGVLCLVIIAALVIAPSFLVRYLLIDYLHEAGVSADIGHVDADIFTGTVIIDNAHGKTASGEVFNIGHAALELRYTPLLHKRISLSGLTLDDARLDVRRSADNALKVGGITVISAKPRQNAPLQWGLGLTHLALDRVVVHYRRTARDSQPAINRVLKIHSASIRNVATWQPDANVPFNAHLSVGDSQLRLSGQALPFGPTRSARFKLATKDFALSLLAPLTHVSGLSELAGTLNGQQQIDIEYDPHKALTTTVDGTTRWTGAALATHSGLRIASRAIDWQGTLKATVLRANGQPGRLDTTSILNAKGVNITQPNTFTLKQTSIRWKGSATATLAGASTTVSTRGLLATTGTHLEAPGRLNFSTAHDSLQGLIQIGLTANATHLNTNGTFKARHLALSVPKGMAFSSDRVTYHGAAHTALENKQTQLETDGKLGLDGLFSAVPHTSRMRARHVELTHVGGLNKLAGTLNGQQQIDVEYDPHEALTITVDGTMRWTGAALASHSGLRIASRAIDWQGTLKATVLRANGQPGRLDTTSTLNVKGVNITQPNTFTLKQTSIRWSGSATATLAGASTTASTQGLLATTGTHLEAPGRLDFSTAHDSLQGLVQIALTAKATDIKTKGTFKARHLALSVPKGMAFSGDRLTYHGAAHTALENKQTQIDTDGKMRLDGLSFTVPDTSRMSARHVDWNGDATIRSAKLLGRRAAGLLAATGVKLDLPGQPMAVSADRFAFKGEYGEQTDADGRALKLTVNGDFNSHKLAVTDTRIHAPWFTALQTHGDKLAIDGLDSIALSALECSGIRILGDTDTDSALIQAVGLTARQFQFKDLAHYHVADLDISSAIIHARRDPGSLGVLSEFFPSSMSQQTAGASKSAANKHGAGSTYAIDRLNLSGLALAFVDTAVTPAVRIHGSNLDFTLNNLDTAKPDNNASYQLALDIGAYGHLDSRGTIAPMAPGGVDFTLSARLRSLAMAPLSGYLNAAMGREIASGAADGTLRLTSQRGQLGGEINTTWGNFRLANGSDKQTDVALGLSLDTALALVRGRNDQFDFKTPIRGDFADPDFSIRHLIREAVLSGIRTAVLSNYSPLGLLNRAKNAILDLGHSLGSRPAIFAVGKHYIRAEDRDYLGRLAHSLLGKPGLVLTIQSHAVPGDADALSPWQSAAAGRDNNRTPLEKLAQRRAQAVRDYLAARNVSPNRIKIAAPTINSNKNAKPEVTFSISGQ